MEAGQKRLIGRRQCRFLRVLMEMGSTGGIAEVASRSGFTPTEVLQVIDTLVSRNLIGFDGNRVWIPSEQANHVTGLLRVWCQSDWQSHRICDRVLEILSSRGPLTVRRLADTAGISYKAVKKAVSVLEAEGKVERVRSFEAGGRTIVRICGDSREPAASTAGAQRRKRGRRDWLTLVAIMARSD